MLAGLASIVSGSCSSSPTSPGSGNSTYVALVNSPVLTVTPGDGTNLLANPTFTRNGLPSLDGWGSNELSELTSTFEHPDVGDTYSMGIESPGAFGETYITGISGRITATLTYWAKVPAQQYESGLSVSLVQTRSDSGQLSMAAQFDTTSVWKEFTLSDTVDVLPGDRIWVDFMGTALIPVSPRRMK